MSLPKAFTIYPDGGVIDRNPSPFGGPWAYVLVGVDPATGDDVVLAEASGMVLLEDLGGLPYVSNNLTEYLAILMALEAAPDGWSGLIRGDSLIALTTFASDKPRDWLPPDYQRRMAAAKERLGPIATELLGGHPTKKQMEQGLPTKRGLPWSVWNIRADDLCNAAKLAYAPGTMPAEAVA